MVQTTPASALLGVNTSGQTAAGGSPGGDGGAFSREFEQVSNSAEPQRNAHSGSSGDGAETSAGTRAGSNASEKPEQQTDQADSGGEQKELAAGGKTLPPDGDVEAGQEPEESLLSDEVETTLGLIQAVVQQEAKQALTAPAAETKPLASTLVGGEAKADSSTDETLSFSTLRMRELNLATMDNAGREGGNTAANQGKGDNALFTLVNGSARSATAFGDMLNTSTAAAMNTAQPQQTAPSLPAQLSIAMPLQQSGWDQAMGERVVWMARSNIQQAQIQLNPRELGPIEIKISMQNDQTHVNFVAHHATTRDAIEAALPRLREMLGEQGLNLGQADVSQHSFGDNQRQAAVADDGRNSAGSQQGLTEGEESDSEVTLLNSRAITSAVDYFA
jgi:flagellar hook-length control protein FliK